MQLGWLNNITKAFPKGKHHPTDTPNTTTWPATSTGPPTAQQSSISAPIIHVTRSQLPPIYSHVAAICHIFTSLPTELNARTHYSLNMPEARAHLPRNSSESNCSVFPANAATCQCSRLCFLLASLFLHLLTKHRTCML